MLRRAIEEYNTLHGLRLTPKVVLFDMDGTLIDSMPNHAIAWTAAFEHIGIAFSRDDAYLTEGARGVDTIRQRVHSQQGRTLSEAQARAIYADKAQIFASLPPPQIMPGARELMALLRQSGVQIGIVTGSAQKPLIRRIIEEFGEYVEADAITTAYDVARGKPDPAPYLYAMAKGFFAPHETIVVENAPLGITAGRRSGAFTIAVNTGPLRDEVLLSAGAHVLFKSMPALAAEWAAEGFSQEG